MAVQWDILQNRYDELAVLLADPHLDNTKRHKLRKEFSRLTNILGKYKEISSLLAQIAHAQKQAGISSDPEMAELFMEEASDLQRKVDQEQAALDLLMFP